MLNRYKADGDLCEVDRTTLEVKPMEADAWRKVKKEEGDKTKASSRGGEEKSVKVQAFEDIRRIRYFREPLAVSEPNSVLDR